MVVETISRKKNHVKRRFLIFSSKHSLSQKLSHLKSKNYTMKPEQIFLLTIHNKALSSLYIYLFDIFTNHH